MRMRVRDCPFCVRVMRREYDYSNAYCVAFEPLHPVTPGHLLVVPTAHVRSALEDPAEAADAARFAAWLAGDLEVSAFNLITSSGTAATQSIFHLHWHLVPRREGDSLALPWTGQAEREGRAGQQATLGASPASVPGRDDIRWGTGPGRGPR